MRAWKPVSIHLAWALAVAGAWWLGARRETESSAGKTTLTDRLTEPIPSAAGHAGPAAASPPAAAAAIKETADWLKQWSGPNGIVSPEQMTAAVQAALSDPDSVRGLRHFTHLLAALTPENAPAVARVLQNHTSADAGSWMLMLASAWGAVDGGKAQSELLAIGGHIRTREAALAAWASVSPEQAKAWLAAQLSMDPPQNMWQLRTAFDEIRGFTPDQKRALRASLVTGLAKNDPAAAVAYVAGLSDDRGELTRVVAGEQLRNGAPAAAKWAAELPDESMRGAALEAVARRYMQVDSAAGAQWGAEIADERDTRAAVGRVADRIAEKDVRAAFEWTLKLPPGPGQEEAFQQVFSEWARQDPGASSQELQRMTPGPERDNAIHSFSRILVNESPEDAIIWATAITDPTLRLDTQLDVVREWNTKSPDAARTWVAANLPADARAKALAPPDD